MAEEPIYIDPSTPIRESLSNLPAAFKSFLKKGFSVIAGLDSKEKTAAAFDMVLDEGTAGGRLNRTIVKEISERLSIQEDDVPPMVTTATFCTTLFIQEKTLIADEFLSVMAQQGIISDQLRSALRPFVALVEKNRAVAADATERNTLAAKLLPSLTRFSTAIDVRPQFTDDGEAVRYAVPVILTHITTDANKKGLWLQMSKKQAERLISDLTKALKRVEVAEKWSATGKTSGKM